MYLNSTKHNRRRDRKNLGPGGVKRINKQLDKGVPYKKALKREQALYMSRTIAPGSRCNRRSLGFSSGSVDDWKWC